VTDQVNSPDHYTFGGMETIDILKAKMSPERFRGYLLGNVLKYLTRSELKGKPVQDIAKARWYLRRYELEVIEERQDERTQKETE